MKKFVRITLLTGLLLVSPILFTNSYDKEFEWSKNLDIFQSLLGELELYYVDETDPAKMIKTGIDQIMKTLDPYTVYIPESQIEDIQLMTTGEYGGVGAMISQDSLGVYITDPYAGSPAQKAGMRAGDRIVKVDDKSVAGKSSAEISPMMKGAMGTEVKITVERPMVKGTITFDLIREKIRFENVPYFAKLSDGSGYIRLTGFTEGASAEVKNALLDLKSRGADKIILDLRNNPGGLLIEAVDIMNIFVAPGQEIVSTRGKSKKWEATYTCRYPTVDTLIPVAVLVNSGSASASEIVAGAMQDLDRGVIIGQRTFGKGLVQTTRDLSYNAKIKLTTAKYYIASGRCIQALDYTNRRADGSVGHIPDSLVSEFRTKTGRIVKDGGGILPDVLVETRILSGMATNLAYQNMIFDFATRYRNTHEQIASPAEYALDESEYQNFKSYLADRKFTYKSASESALDGLIKSAKKEKYYDLAQASLDDLKNTLSHNLDKDMQTFKPEITTLLSDEIIGRYYFQKGRIEYMLRDDNGLQKAQEVLANSAGYRKMLKR
ncbi:MAG: S41 family peptidase [Bacteroidales bacterium]|nr:S41 family peptidase [Bacteroidales bacterium]